MGNNSKIDWTDHTWNPWYGCPDDGKRSPACNNCYAKSWAKRSGIVDFDNEIKLSSSATFNAPNNMEKYRSGDKVFVCSLSDFFHSNVNLKWQMEAFKFIQHKRPDLNWIFLTKRPENIKVGQNWPSYESLTPNLWLGVTAENQEQANFRIPQLLKIPAAVHFVSCEPLIENINLTCYMRANLDWVICGGESGGRPRELKPAWVSSLQHQCFKVNIPFFFKQWGGKTKHDLIDGKKIKQFPYSKMKG